MDNLNDIFCHGPGAVLAWVHRRPVGVDELDAKLLADNCWSSAGEQAEIDIPLARQWGRAALSVYEFLTDNAKPMVAESARENAQALRAWDMLRDESPAA